MKKIVLVIILVTIGIISVVFYLQQRSQSTTLPPSSTASSTPPSAVNQVQCLTSSEVASYEATNNHFKNISDVGTVTISNKIAGDKITTFNIGDVIPSHYHAYELHPCGIYVLRQFNYDYIRGNVLSGYSMQLWKYDYAGTGIELAPADDFRVDSDESLVAIMPFLTTSSESLLIIQNLQSQKSIFTLSDSQIAKQNPSIIGALSFENGGWSNDGRYFWFSFAQGANVIGFVQINTSDWSYQSFSVPQTMMGGDAFNPNTGMTTYRTNVAPWTGDETMDQYYRDQAVKLGKITSFYIFNLLTKKNYLVATTTDPTYYYHPRWLSDNVLQYTLPSGTTSMYTIPQQ